MECITKCTRCGAKWEGDFEYCLKCEPVLAQAERSGIAGAFDDCEPCDDSEQDQRQDAFLRHRIEETKEHMNLNYESWDDDGEGFTDGDALDELMDECGQTPDGYCSLAGTEYCDWECPFSG